MWETGFKNLPRQTASVWGPVLRCRPHTDFFAPAHPPVGQKTSLLNFKHKITTSAIYTDSIGTRYTVHLTTKKICVHSKRLKKTTSKSINQIRPVLMP